MSVLATGREGGSEAEIERERERERGGGGAGYRQISRGKEINYKLLSTLSFNVVNNLTI